MLEENRVDKAANSSVNPREAGEAVEEYVDNLLGGAAVYTVPEAAGLCGLSIDQVLRFWRSLGFPFIDDIDNERLFTEGDIEAMRSHAAIMKNLDTSAALNEDAVRALVRAQSQSMDRLVRWQQEALIDHAEKNLSLDPVAARLWVLDNIERYEKFLAGEMMYAWKRHTAALIRRTDAELRALPNDGNDVQMRRALGFVDMVSFTRRSGELADEELVDLIETFDRACRDIITSKGARVVKTIGDAFLYVADTIDIAADVTTTIVDELRKIDRMLPIRASIVWGSVIARFGDIFGPTVNLASRLADAALPNTVLTDEKTAAILHKLGSRYATVDLGRRDLKGIGEVRLMELRRIYAPPTL